MIAYGVQSKKATRLKPKAGDEVTVCSCHGSVKSKCITIMFNIED